MLIYRPLFGFTSLICLGACQATTGGNIAGEENGVANASSGNEGATASAGACPFETRGWEATIMPAPQPGEQPSVALNGEVRPDSDGRAPMQIPLGEVVGERQPPVLVLELSSDAAIDPQTDRGWMAAGAVFTNYTPDYTHAAVRCANAEIARVPILPSP